MTGHNRIPTKAPRISDALFRELVAGGTVGGIASLIIILMVIA